MTSKLNRSNNYIGFARQYRPQSFSELKGQNALVKVLTHSIVNDRLAKGYLLTGIRGVGKTTSARIIAKTINCTNLITKDEGVFPCESCQNCRSFKEQKHPDIIEIDAASRTGVDDIRQVIESSEYMPLLGGYKVFIIDEVHMLSKGAFNALLKVLEEPPPHVVFIFATTEVQKIPLTVISRCQRYDLKRLSTDEIIALLKEIAGKENISIEEEALTTIAAKSEGSAREAVSLLDQAVSMAFDTEVNVTDSLISQMLGIVPIKTMIMLLGHIVEHKTSEAIDLINQTYVTTGNPEEFLKDFSDFIAYLSKAKALKNYRNNSYAAFDNQITDLLTKLKFSQLSILWQIITKGIQEIKHSHNQLVATEMIILKAIYAQEMPSVEDIINKSSTNAHPRQF
jgi:DNA polymerase-3 subunit gamma/tau